MMTSEINQVNFIRTNMSSMIGATCIYIQINFCFSYKKYESKIISTIIYNNNFQHVYTIYTDNRDFFNLITLSIYTQLLDNRNSCIILHSYLSKSFAGLLISLFGYAKSREKKLRRGPKTNS